EAFELVPSLELAYVWHASKFTREVLDGLLRIGFLHHQQIIWYKGRAVLTRTPYWFAHEPCWFVRKKNAPWYGKPGENTTIWDSLYGRRGRRVFRREHPDNQAPAQGGGVSRHHGPGQGQGARVGPPEPVQIGERRQHRCGYFPLQES